MPVIGEFQIKLFIRILEQLEGLHWSLIAFCSIVCSLINIRLKASILLRIFAERLRYIRFSEYLCYLYLKHIMCWDLKYMKIEQNKEFFEYLYYLWYIVADTLWWTCTHIRCKIYPSKRPKKEHTTGCLSTDKSTIYINMCTCMSKHVRLFFSPCDTHFFSMTVCIV